MVELSNTIHPLSEIISKFKSSLEHLEDILSCQNEKFKEITLVLVIGFRKIRNKSEFDVIFKNKHINICGQKPLFVKLNCGESVFEKLHSGNRVVLSVKNSNNNCNKK
jgi:hypothetical protein